MHFFVYTSLCVILIDAMLFLSVYMNVCSTFYGHAISIVKSVLGRVHMHYVQL